MVGHSEQMRAIEQQPHWDTEYGTPEDANARTHYAGVIAYILTQHIAANKMLGTTENAVVVDFDCARGSLPSVSLYDYVMRIMRYAPASKELYVAGLVLIDRILSMNPSMLLTERNVHRLFVAAIAVASKFFDDLFYTNKFFASVACLDVNELNGLEICFLVRIKFGLYIRKELFLSYVKPFEQIVSFARTNSNLFDFYSAVYPSYRENVIRRNSALQLHGQCV